MPKVSVIIPNYNHARFLDERINSVLNQTFQDFEIIILDDCSTDDSKSVINNYRENPKVSHIVLNDINSGSTFRQWEKGLGLAKGKYIWIAESDDFCTVDFLETAYRALENNNAGLFFCQSHNADDQSTIIGDYLSWFSDITAVDWGNAFCMNGKDFIEKALLAKNVIINASGAVFKKVAVEFNDLVKFKKCGDWLFYINLLKGSKICYSPNKMNYFRSHHSSTRNVNEVEQKIVMDTEVVAVKEKLIAYKFLPIGITRQKIKHILSYAPWDKLELVKKLYAKFSISNVYFIYTRFISYKIKNNFGKLFERV